MKPPRIHSRIHPTSIRIVEQEKIELTQLARQEGISLAQYLLQGARLKKHVDALAKDQAKRSEIRGEEVQQHIREIGEKIVAESKSQLPVRIETLK